MQTMVAFTFRGEVSEDRVGSAASSVESYYTDLWPRGFRRESLRSGHVGLVVWDHPEASCAWPSWSRTGDEAVATMYAPVGYEDVVGDLSPEAAPHVLAHALAQDPTRVRSMTPPLVMAALDAEAGVLQLHTDALGIGRLFVVAVDDGLVWSNRPAAALRFAGVRAHIDDESWQFADATAWFMGDRMPVKELTVVPAATHIVVDARGGVRTTNYDLLGNWLQVADREPGATAPDVAASLVTAASSITGLWDGDITLDLTGGRDSRLVAAAFLTAGVPVTLNTNDSEDGEVSTARELVSRLPFDVEHVINPRSRPGAGPGGVLERPLMESAREWHAYGEGLRPSSYLLSTAPRTHSHAAGLLVGGVGGELAHGFYYPADAVEVADDPPARQHERLLRHLTLRMLPRGHVGITPEAAAAVRHQASAVMRRFEAAGARGATVLDAFYAQERMRRWGTTAERRGVVSFLLHPAFIGAALALRPEHRLGAELHRAVLHELRPEWDDVPFLKLGAVRQVKARPAAELSGRRCAEAVDADVIRGLLSDDRMTAAGFDLVDMRDLWRRSEEGTSTPMHESLLHRLVWRAAYDDYVTDLNREERVRRERVSVLAPEPPEAVPTVPAVESGQPPALRRSLVRRARSGLRQPAVAVLARRGSLPAPIDRAVDLVRWSPPTTRAGDLVRGLLDARDPWPPADTRAHRLLVAPANFAGQGHAWARAVDAHLPTAVARSWTYTTDPTFDFPHDHAVPVTVYRAPRRVQQALRNRVAREFDAVVIEAGRPLFGRLHQLDPVREARDLRDAGLRVALLWHGTDIRVPSIHARSHPRSPYGGELSSGLADRVGLLEGVARRNRRRSAEHEGPVLVSTPDLLGEQPHATWCPVVIDPGPWAVDEAPLQRTRPVVVHVPSNPWLKGTDLVTPVLRGLDERGLITYRPVDRLPASEVRALYRSADVVLDQFRLGIYGVAACEAMAAGRLVVSDVDEAVRATVRDRTGLDLPVVQAEPERLAEVLEAVVADRAGHRERAAAGPGFVRAVHDGRHSAQVLAVALDLG